MNIMQLTQTMRILPPMITRSARVTTQPTLPGWEIVPPEKPAVTNQQIAQVLSNIADILDVQKSNPYRIQAYRNAARGVLELDEAAATLLKRKERLPVPGLGQRLRSRITELVETGTMTFYSDLCFQSLPHGVRTLLAIRYVGVQTAIRLYQELDIDTPEKLWQAAAQHRIRKLFGFGPRSEARLREHAEQFLAQRAGRQLDGAA
jgi:DNA polymerase/3'-5' exonuclease PolX